MVVFHECCKSICGNDSIQLATDTIMEAMGDSQSELTIAAGQLKANHIKSLQKADEMIAILLKNSNDVKSKVDDDTCGINEVHDDVKEETKNDVYDKYAECDVQSKSEVRDEASGNIWDDDVTVDDIKEWLSGHAKRMQKMAEQEKILMAALALQ